MLLPYAPTICSHHHYRYHYHRDIQQVRPYAPIYVATGLTEDYHPLFGVVDQERYDKCDVEQTRSVNSEGPNDNDDDFGVDDFSSEDGIAPGLEVRALRHRIYSPSWSRLKNYTRCTHRSALRALNYSARNRRTYRRALRGASFYSPLPPVEATVPPASSNLCGTSGCVLLDGHMGPHMIHARGVCDFVEVQPNYTSAAAMRQPSIFQQQQMQGEEQQRQERRQQQQQQQQQRQQQDRGSRVGPSDAAANNVAPADNVANSQQDFSCWSARGNWTLHGYTWHEAHNHHGVSLLERVRGCLEANAWCWDMDFTLAPPPAHGWFHVTPLTLTRGMADTFAMKAYDAVYSDKIGARAGRRLPEAQQRRKRLAWVHEFVYLWNSSRGWCAGPCMLNDEPLLFSTQNPDPNDDSGESMKKFSWSAQRNYNECHHQFWNMTTLLHGGCNSHWNSHPTNGYAASRCQNPSLPAFTLRDGQLGGGPTGAWADHWGADTLTAPPEISRDNRLNSNKKRLDIWLDANGFLHSDTCPSGPGFRSKVLGGCPEDTCPYGLKRVELIESLGGATVYRGTGRSGRHR